MSDNFTGPLNLGDLTHNEVNFLCAAGTVGGFDPRNLVTASHDEASRALGSGVYKGAGDGSLKNLSWQQFLAKKVRQVVKDEAAQAVNPYRVDAYNAFLAYSGSYQSRRGLMV
jgi:hypothetical protein